MALSPRRRHRPTGATPSLEQEVYRLRVTSTDLEGTAELLLRASMSLAELHELLADQLAAPEVDVPYRFTAHGGQSPQVISGDEAPRSLLGGLGLAPESTLSYEARSSVEGEPWLLDFEVREVTAPDPSVTYPVVLSWDLHTRLEDLGFSPDLDLDDEDEGPEIDPDLEPIFQLIDAAIASDFPDEDSHPDLDNHVALGRRLVELTRSRPQQLEAMSEAMDYDLVDWLWELQIALENQHRYADALSFLDELASFPEFFPEVREPRAMALIKLDRADEARTLVESLLSDSEKSADEPLLAHALRPLVELGELARAEALAYRLRRADDTESQYDAAAALATIYRRTGRKREARKMELEAERLQDRLLNEMEEEDSDDEFVAPDASFAPDPATIRAMAKSMGVDLDRMGITPEQLMQDALEGRMTVPSDGPSAAPLHDATAPVRREMPKVGRNDPCPCNSGKKYKKCHGA